MVIRKKYPQREYSQISTSTDLSCASCLGAIKRFEKCLVSDDGKYYHTDCKPTDSPEVKGGVKPSAASGEGEEDGRE